MSCNVLIARIYNVEKKFESNKPRARYQTTACGKKEVCGVSIHAMRYRTQAFSATVSVCAEHKAELEELGYGFFEKMRYSVKNGTVLPIIITEQILKDSTVGKTAFQKLWGVPDASCIKGFEFVNLKELSTKEQQIRDELRDRFAVSMDRKKHAFLSDDDYRELLEEAINIVNIKRVMEI